MKSVLQYILKLLAKATITKYQPLVIGITGSVGKTSTREAVAAIVQKKYTVGKQSKNFNNEIGLPLTIIQASDSGYRNPFKWLAIFFRALKNIICRNPNYPQSLVLEMGIDHKGDMDYLLSIVQPQVGVLTAVSEVHLEYLGSIQGVANEKAKLLKSLPGSGFAVYNGDQEELSGLGEKIKTRSLTFGFKEINDVWADGLQLSVSDDGEVRGFSFKLHHKGSVTPLLLPDVLGQHQVIVALAAAAVGIGLEINAVDIGAVLKDLHFPNGRMKLLPGIKGSKIIDDSYNSSPLALKEALHTLSHFTSGARWAVLGDMLELGRESESLHQECGQELVRSGINKLVTVGERSRDIGRGALKQGLTEDSYVHFAGLAEAAHYVQEKVQTGDTILVKGSQGVRMEKITKELMAEPERAKDLLVRQYKPWI